MWNRAGRALPTLVVLSVLGIAGCGGDSADQHGRRGGPGGGGPGFAKGKGRPGGGEEPPVPVVATRATRGEIEAFLDASTTLTAEASVDVVSQATGVVAEILVEEGDLVSKDQVMARLAYEEVELAEARARSEQERLQANYARAEQLRREQLIPEEDYQQTQFDLARAEIDWRQAALDLAHTRVLAPISGTVTERMINVGNLVRENDPIYRVIDFDSLVAPVFIPEKHLGDLHVGQPAVVTPPALGGREVRASVKRISPIVDSQSGTVEVLLEMVGSRELRPGMFANARLVLDRHEDVVLLPKKTLVYDDERPYVFVIEEGRARKRELELGYQDERRVEVVRGVAADELVVLVGQSTLKEGGPVIAEDEAGEPLDVGTPGPPETPGEAGREGPPVDPRS